MPKFKFNKYSSAQFIIFKNVKLDTFKQYRLNQMLIKRDMYTNDFYW